MKFPRGKLTLKQYLKRQSDMGQASGERISQLEDGKFYWVSAQNEILKDSPASDSFRESADALHEATLEAHQKLHWVFR